MNKIVAITTIGLLNLGIAYAETSKFLVKRFNMMKRKLSVIVALVASTIGAAGNVSARPEFVASTGASGCTDCHFNNLGNGPWKPGVLDAYYANGVPGLAAYIKSLSAGV